MTEKRTSEAQKRATQAYRARNREKTNKQSAKSAAKTYIRRYANFEELQELKKIIRKEEMKMEILKFENLMFTTANEDGTMDLEFQSEDKKAFIRNVEIPDEIDEFYWDDPKNVQKAIEDADEEDIEILD